MHKHILGIKTVWKIIWMKAREHEFPNENMPVHKLGLWIPQTAQISGNMHEHESNPTKKIHIFEKLMKPSSNCPSLGRKAENPSEKKKHLRNKINNKKEKPHQENQHQTHLNEHN